MTKHIVIRILQPAELKSLAALRFDFKHEENLSTALKKIINHSSHR